MNTSDGASGLLRLIYTSSAVGEHYLPILRISQANNGIDGVSGLLGYKDGRFVQVLEGPPDSVREAFQRIARDPRHADVQVLSDGLVSERAFGGWTMAGLPSDDEGIVRERLHRMLRDVPDEVRAAFQDF